MIAVLDRCKTTSQWLARLPPNSQCAMSRGENKIVVACQQHQVVTNAELRDHGVDRADLQAGAAAAIAQIRSVDVIHPVRSQ